MNSKNLTTKIEKDMIIISMGLSFLILLGGLLSLIWTTSILFGVLFGLGTGWISIGALLGLKKIDFIYKRPGLYSWSRFSSRVLIGIGLFCTIIWGVNPVYNNGSTLQQMLGPVNAFAFLVSYSFLAYAVFFIPLLEKLKVKKHDS